MCGTPSNTAQERLPLRPGVVGYRFIDMRQRFITRQRTQSRARFALNGSGAIARLSHATFTFSA